MQKQAVVTVVLRDLTDPQADHLVVLRDHGDLQADHLDLTDLQVVLQADAFVVFDVAEAADPAVTTPAGAARVVLQVALQVTTTTKSCDDAGAFRTFASFFVLFSGFSPASTCSREHSKSRRWQ